MRSRILAPNYTKLAGKASNCEVLHPTRFFFFCLKDLLKGEPARLIYTVAVSLEINF